jgi:hypothetical protein
MPTLLTAGKPFCRHFAARKSQSAVKENLSGAAL